MLALPALLGGADAGARELGEVLSGKELPRAESAEADRRAQPVTLRLETRLTWSDNASATRGKNPDWILEISPGIRFADEHGRLTGIFNASWRNVGYARNDRLSQSFATVQSANTLEAVEDMLFIDLDSNIGRNNRSPFHGRVGDDNLNAAREDEVRTWALGPRLQFRLGDAAQGALRYRSGWLDGNALEFDRQHEQLWAGQVGNARASRFLGWNLEYSRSGTEYDISEQEFHRRLGRATLFLNLMPELRLRLAGGRESNDYGFDDKEDKNIWGGGFDWQPTPRTEVSLLSERRAFGSGYNFSFSHRARRTLWEIGGNRGISSSLDSLGGSLYQDPQFLAWFNNPNLVAMYPDPAQREALVRGLLHYPSGDFITNAYYRDESWRAGMTYTGVRNSVTLSAQRSRRKRVSLGSLSPFDSFALASDLEMISGTLSLTRRLTALSSLNAVVTYWRTKGKGTDNDGLDSRRTSASLGVNARLGLQTQAGLIYNYQRSDTEVADGDYIENSVSANLGMTF
ncbi:MAG: TIGR03016 family PEP-CTERM system-associated outer membrane protein [Azoarcus sp.]|nr:TIGR03016 family PEP-CTERM system-associated outer membrane protein [Azoarcus sp.]